MEPVRKWKGLRAARILIPGLLVFVIAWLLGPTRGATASSGDPGTPPPDGKYENVTVEGRTVPMVHVMNGASVVLVDTDGTKPRKWEEQFKRKGNLPKGTFNVHKTSVGGTDSFESIPIDREGTWTIDDKANIAAQ